MYLFLYIFLVCAGVFLPVENFSQSYESSVILSAAKDHLFVSGFEAIGALMIFNFKPLPTFTNTPLTIYFLYSAAVHFHLSQSLFVKQDKKITLDNDFEEKYKNIIDPYMNKNIIDFTKTVSILPEKFSLSSDCLSDVWGKIKTKPRLIFWAAGAHFWHYGMSQARTLVS